MAGAITISSNEITGASTTKVIGPVQINGFGQVAEILDITISGAGSTTITGPVGATGAVVTPPSNNAVVLTLKGDSGDTGIQIQPGQPFVITFVTPTNASSFVLTSAGAISGTIEVSYF